MSRRLFLGLLVAGIVVWLGCGEDTAIDTPTLTGSAQAIFPQDHATNVPTNASLLVQFSREVEAASAESSISIQPAVAGTARYNPKTRTMVFTPDTELLPGQHYQVTIDGVMGIAGEFIEAISYSFSVGPHDMTFPTLTHQTPKDNETDVARSLQPQITMTFDDAMDPTSFQEGFSIQPEPYAPRDMWKFEWSEQSTMVSISLRDLGRLQTYEVTLDPDKVKSLCGLPMSSGASFTFTTHVGDDVENINPNGGSSTRDIWNISRGKGGKWSVSWPRIGNHFSHRGECTVRVLGGHILGAQFTRKHAQEATLAYIHVNQREMGLLIDTWLSTNTITFTTDAEKVVFEGLTYKGRVVDPEMIWIGKKRQHPSSAKEFALINSDLPTLH